MISMDGEERKKERMEEKERELGLTNKQKQACRRVHCVLQDTKDKAA